MIPDDMGNVIERPTCRLRYQQSPVDVYAHFMASNHDSGRVTYLVNRRTWLRVTDLILPLLRVSDPRIANLRGRILQGRSMGRTEVQVNLCISFCNIPIKFIINILIGAFSNHRKSDWRKRSASRKRQSGNS